MNQCLYLWNFFYRHCLSYRNQRGSEDKKLVYEAFQAPVCAQTMGYSHPHLLSRTFSMKQYDACAFWHHGKNKLSGAAVNSDVIHQSISRLFDRPASSGCPSSNTTTIV